MFEKRKYFFGILIISCLLIFTGCSVRKNVKNEKIKEFTESILESNEKIKEMSFYFLRPGLYAELVYEGDLDEENLQNIKDEFKTLINIEFMERIGDKYFGGSTPWNFDLYIYVDNKREESYDYCVSSRYYKTHVVNEDPENIDGYETWRISGKKDSGVIIDGPEYETNEIEGIQLIVTNITSLGLTLVCKQSDEKPIENLQIDKSYHLQEQIDNQWISVEGLHLSHEQGVTEAPFIVPLNDALEWEINWTKLYGELPAGSYRIGISISTSIYDSNSYYANFKIVN